MANLTSTFKSIKDLKIWQIVDNPIGKPLSYGILFLKDVR